MNFHVEPLFPTPVFLSHFDDFKNTYIDIDNYQENLFFSNLKQPNVINHKSKNILLEDKFKDLKILIDSLMSKFVYDVLCIPELCKLKLTSSWITIGLPGSITHQHYHCNSVYSGIFYLKSIEGSGELIFSINGNTPTFSTTTIRPKPVQYNMFNSTEWRIKPITGDIVLFPSHLPHSVSENISGENRAALAFNYFLIGSISDHSTNTLYL